MLKVLETMIVCQDRLGTNTRIAWFKNGGVSGKATRLVLYYKCIILARQARDKHIGKPLKTGRVAACAGESSDYSDDGRDCQPGKYMGGGLASTR